MTDHDQPKKSRINVTELIEGLQWALHHIRRDNINGDERDRYDRAQAALADALEERYPPEKQV